MKLNLKYIFVLLLCVAISLSIYFINVVAKNPFIGIVVDKQNGSIIVSEIENNSWADRMGITVGDHILEIDGKSPFEHKTIQTYVKAEQLHSIVIEKQNGDVKSYQIDFELDYQTIFQLIVPILVLFLSVYCSYFIYKSNKDDPRISAIVLICFILDISVAYLCGGSSSRGDWPSRYLVTYFFLLAPVLLLHFIYAYFKEMGTVWFSKNVLLFAYGLVLFTSFVDILVWNSQFIHELFNFRDPIETPYLISNNLTLFNFLILFLITYYLIFKGQKKVSYKVQRYMIRVFIISSVTAFIPFVTLYAIPYSLFKIVIFSPVFLSSFLLIIPFSLVYQFLATKIYDIEFLIGRLRYYTLLGIIPSLVGLLIVSISKNYDTTTFIIRTFICLYLLSIVTFYFKEIVDYKFNLIRFSEKFNYKDSIFKYIQCIKEADDIEEVIGELKKVIHDVLLITNTYTFKIHKEAGTIITKAPMEITTQYEELLQKCIDNTGSIIELQKGFILNIGETDKFNYLLLCTARVNTPKLTRDERNWLETLAYYTNVTLSKYQKIEGLLTTLERLESEGKSPPWFNKVLFSLEEKQRSALAQDLHDSVLQEMISLNRKAEIALDSPDKSMEILKNIQSGLQQAIQITRETCNELRPQILYDLGLTRALERLVALHENYESYEINLNTSRLQVPDNIETQLHIYRIVQELLSNARKHSKAKKILIILISIKEKTILHYEDDGTGTDSDKVFSREGSMGLSGIKERVNVLRGSMEVDTEPNKGFKMIIEI